GRARVGIDTVETVGGPVRVFNDRSGHGYVETDAGSDGLTWSDGGHLAPRIATSGRTFLVTLRFDSDPNDGAYVVAPDGHVIQGFTWPGNPTGATRSAAWDGSRYLVLWGDVVATAVQ